jgi:uncharacterized protein YwqG
MATTDPIDLISCFAPLTGHTDYLRRIAKARVDIALTKESPRVSGSRFGGHPFVPRDFRWPNHPVGTYRFLGQIDFAEIPCPPEPLPTKGLLCLFYAEDDQGEIFWGDDGYVVGFYWPHSAEHAIFHAPTGKAPKAKALSFQRGLDLPRHSELRDDWPFGEDALECLTTEAAEALAASEDYLLGYPSFCSLAYDPTPGDGWIALLTVQSHDRLDWCWHDGDKLMLFIEADKLAALDFSNIKTDAG